MRLTWGATRFVILIGTKAIKIARIPIARPIIRLVRGFFRDHDLKERLANHDPRFAMAVLKYFACGFIANRLELEISQTHAHLPIARTRHSYLWGLVNVQERGVPAWHVDLRDHYFTRILPKGELANEILMHRQFCVIDNAVLLADYGNPELRAALAKTA